MYKKIFIEQEETFYRIYDDGRVMSEKTGRFYKGTIRDGYRFFDLNWKNKRFSKSQHRLIAEYFIPNPNNLPCVHHKDGNRLNNSIDNLQWVSFQENNLAINKQPFSKDHSDKNDYYDISKEVWRTFRNTRYAVSNFGRVKNCETGNILKGKINDRGYREHCLTIDRHKKTYLCHRIVWEVWKGEKAIVINHINGNKLDNRIDNLENVTARENTIKAIYETQTLKFKKTACFDKEGNLIQVFMNNADAARAMNVKPASIWAAINKGYFSCGYYWKNLEE